ncbi:39928_t:CDS:1, partial [Gigaspora margarita]
TINPAKNRYCENIIKGNYDNFGIGFKKMREEIDNLLEKIETETTKLNVKL